MTGIINVTITGQRELVARLAALPTNIRGKVRLAVDGLARKLEAHVKNDKLNGQVLRKVTGALQGSIHSESYDTGEKIVGRVFSDKSVNYAAIHEFGGTIPDRYPVRAKALSWMAGGQRIFAMKAKGFQMPERSFLRSSLADMKDEIVQTLNAAVQEGIKS